MTYGTIYVLYDGTAALFADIGSEPIAAEKRDIGVYSDDPHEAFLQWQGYMDANSEALSA